jgi:flagellar assembly protein FliH
MSTNGDASQSLFASPISSYLYPQTIGQDTVAAAPEERKEPEITLTEISLAARLASERSAGYAEAEARLKQELQRRSEDQLSRITQRIEAFEKVQSDYFTRVETEVVQLALSIAGKILHREAQVDPMLIGSIVHYALGQMRDGSVVTLRVRPGELQRWEEYLERQNIRLTVNMMGDAELQEGDCILETELGAVNFSLDRQLKEIERGFFDVLAKKPEI